VSKIDDDVDDDDAMPKKQKRGYFVKTVAGHTAQIRQLLVVRFIFLEKCVRSERSWLDSIKRTRGESENGFDLVRSVEGW